MEPECGGAGAGRYQSIADTNVQLHRVMRYGSISWCG
jgi:hypothetical protein